MNYEERQKIIASSPISLSYLKRFNTAAGILHLTQGIVMLLLGLLLEWTRDVYIFYLKLNIVSPGPPPVFDAVSNPEVLFIVGNACIICGSNSSQRIFQKKLIEAGNP